MRENYVLIFICVIEAWGTCFKIDILAFKESNMRNRKTVPFLLLAFSLTLAFVTVLFTSNSTTEDKPSGLMSMQRVGCVISHPYLHKC